MVSVHLDVTQTCAELPSGKRVHTFQYSVTEYFLPYDENINFMSAIRFKYETSAIAVILKETKTSFFHFITKISATIGGAFALTSLANKITYNVMEKSGGS